MRGCSYPGCTEWTPFDRCYGHSKQAWSAGDYTPKSLAERLWLWGAPRAVAPAEPSTRSSNGHRAWIDATRIGEFLDTLDSRTLARLSDWRRIHLEEARALASTSRTPGEAG